MKGTTAPETTTSQEQHDGLPADQEPVVTGTLFLTMIFLMMIFGFWALMYMTLLDR
ncbi:MAG: cytochrome c oxidase subunit 2A [Rhodothermales bacterium]|nr:cytochrome c oxidase subunit 2A [Rhodothermales bacterium]